MTLRGLGAIAYSVSTVPDTTSITPPANTDEIIQVNTQAGGTLTMNAALGSPIDGQRFILRIKTTNAQTFSWNSIYRGSVDIALPTATTGSSKTDYLGFIFNAADTKWDLTAKVFGF